MLFNCFLNNFNILKIKNVIIVKIQNESNTLLKYNIFSFIFSFFSKKVEKLSLLFFL